MNLCVCVYSNHVEDDEEQRRDPVEVLSPGRAAVAGGDVPEAHGLGGVCLCVSLLLLWSVSLYVC